MQRCGLRGCLGRERLRIGLDVARVDCVFLHVGAVEQGAEIAQIGLDPGDPEFSKRPLRLGDGVDIGAMGLVHDHLGQQRIERWARGKARIGEGFHPDAGAGRRIERRERSAGGLRGAGLVHALHVDARLDRIAARLRQGGGVGAEIGEPLAAGDAKLKAHEVEPVDLLGNRMLDLNARVRLDEEALSGVGASVIKRDQELERAEAAIAVAFGQLDRVCGQSIAHLS